jgi:hypothetical protein
LTDNFSEEEFAPIAAAMKHLPQFSPSPEFADKVMARVRIQARQVPAASDRVAMEPAWSAPIERRAPSQVPQTYMRRSIPARLAVTALVASVGVTMTAAILTAVFNLDLFVLVSRIFGQSTMSFLAGLGSDAAATASSTAASSAAAAGTATGVAVIGSFVAGAAAATAALRAAASASRKAA